MTGKQICCVKTLLYDGRGALMAMVAFNQVADFPGSDFSIFHILVYVQLQGWGIMISFLSIDFHAGLKYPVYGLCALIATVAYCQGGDFPT